MRSSKFSLDVLGPGLFVAGELDLGDHSVADGAADGLFQSLLVLAGDFSVLQGVERHEAVGLSAGRRLILSVRSGEFHVLEAEHHSAVINHLENGVFFL